MIKKKKELKIRGGETKMPKILYTYPIKNIEELNYILNYTAISDDPENYELCICRERALEVLYFDNKDACIFYNIATKQFTDIEFKTIELPPDSVLFPRFDIANFHRFLSTTDKTCIETVQDVKRIHNWCRYVPESYTKRKIIQVPAQVAEDTLESCVQQVVHNNKMFIKSTAKHWSFAGTLEEFKQEAMLALCGEQSDVMFSEYLEIKNDKSNKQEYRCYYLLGILRSISLQSDYADDPIPECIKEFAELLQMNLIHTKLLPPNIVIDIAITTKGVVIVECNDPCTSGRYFNNKPQTFPLHI